MQPSVGRWLRVKVVVVAGVVWKLSASDVVALVVPARAKAVVEAAATKATAGALAVDEGPGVSMTADHAAEVVRVGQPANALVAAAVEALAGAAMAHSDEAATVEAVTAVV